MKIRIDATTIETLKSLGLYPDNVGSAIMILESLYNKDYDLLNAFDDLTTSKRALTLYKELERLDFLQRTKNSKYAFSLTQLANECIEIFSDKSIQKIESVEDWIHAYRELWINPDTGSYYQTPDKRSLGASVKDLTNKMKSFLEIYKDSFADIPSDETVHSVIIESTRRYIEEFKKVRFAYCKDAYNFIFKQEGKTKDTVRSLLATACENYIIGKTLNKNDNITRRTKSIN